MFSDKLTCVSASVDLLKRGLSWSSQVSAASNFISKHFSLYCFVLYAQQRLLHVLLVESSCEAVCKIAAQQPSQSARKRVQYKNERPEACVSAPENSSSKKTAEVSSHTLEHMSSVESTVRWRERESTARTNKLVAMQTQQHTSSTKIVNPYK